MATEDPEINVSRVENRVKDGGHTVDKDKIVSRYYRSLDLLADALKDTDRAYIFDNSGAAGQWTWIAEVTDGALLEIKSPAIPAWFKQYVLDKRAPGAALGY